MSLNNGGRYTVIVSRGSISLPRLKVAIYERATGRMLVSSCKSHFQPHEVDGEMATTAMTSFVDCVNWISFDPTSRWRSSGAYSEAEKVGSKVGDRGGSGSFLHLRQ